MYADIKVEKILFQIDGTPGVTCELVSRSRIRVCNGRESWEVDIRPELASNLSPRTSDYCIANPNWEPGARRNYLVSSRDVADWLKKALEDDMTLLSPTSRTCPESGIINFITRFKSRPQRMKLAA